MDKVTLAATRRNPLEERAKDIRANKRIPVEFYGNGEKNISLTVDYQEFRKAFMSAGQSTLVELVIDGKDKKNVMIHEVEFHPVQDTFLHVDLQAVSMKEKVHTFIKLNFVGVSPAIKNLGGVLNENLEEVEVECLPGALLHHIDVDISTLENYHDSIHVKDLPIAGDKHYDILTDLEETICSIAAPEEDKEPETVVDVAAVPTEREEQQKTKESSEA